MTTPAKEETDVIVGMIPDVYDVLSFAGIERALAQDNALGYAVADALDSEQVSAFNNFIEQRPTTPATERILGKLRERAATDGEVEDTSSRFANFLE